MTMFGSQWFANAGSSTAYAVDNSAVFNDGDSQYLNRTFGSPSSASQFGYSFWVKLAAGYDDKYIISADGSGNNDNLYFDSGRITIQEGGATRLQTNQVLRDQHAWYNIVVAYDLGNATNDLKLRLYLNGTEITSFGTNTRSSLSSTSSRLNANGISHDIAANVNNGASTHVNPFDGYLAEFVFVDGAVITPSDVGEEDSNGVWRPISIEDSISDFGNNGFYLPFTTAAGLGQDSSGSTNETKVQENTYNSGSEVNNGDMSGSAAGIAYTAIATAKLATVKINSSSRGFTNVTVQVQTDNGSNAPDGTTLTNGQVTGITGSGTGLKTVDFPNGGPELTAGTKYWIVIPSTDLGSGFEWGIQHDVSGSGGALGIIDGTGYQAGRGFGHEAYQLGNIWTPGNSPTQSGDSPTKNFCVLTPLEVGNGTATFSEGNLKVVQSGGGNLNTFGSIGFSSGKWHYEVTLTNTVDQFGLGIIPVGNVTGNSNQFWNNGIGAMVSGSNDGKVYNNGSNVATITSGSGTDGQTFSCEIDLDNDQLEWFNNAGSSLGTYSFTPTTANGGAYLPCVHCNDDATYVVNFGASTFSKTPTTNFTGISAALLKEQITPAIEDGTAYFQTTTWEGSSSISVPRLISQSGNSTFKPDFVWGKNKDNGSYSHRLYDAVRGATKVLQLGGTSGADAESTDSNGLTDFEANGFDIGNGVHLNDNGETIMAWQWLGANGTATPSGSSGISSLTVSANTTSGFSVGTFTAQSSGSTGVVAHGLGGQADWVIVKPLGSSAEGNDWTVWHSGVNSTSSNSTRTFFNLTTANGSGAASIAAAGTTTFTIPDDAYYHGRNFVFLAWRSIPGFSKFGVFEGTGSATDGPFIELGFKPALFIWKNADSATNGSWTIMDSVRDPFNMVEDNLRADSLMASDTGEADLDFLSNGVKHRGGASARFNASETYIYMAFAEHPFAGTTPATAR